MRSSIELDAPIKTVTSPRRIRGHFGILYPLCWIVDHAKSESSTQCQITVSPSTSSGANRPGSGEPGRLLLLVETVEGRVFTIYKHHWLFACLDGEFH